MRKRILFLMLFMASYSFAQTINDFKAVIIPMRYNFQNEDNQYRMQTITKMNLQKANFKAFYANEAVQKEYPDRCSLLYLDIIKDSGFLVTKLSVVFKDCFGTVIYQTPIGKSREKEYDAAYAESLNLAFVSVYNLKYAYNGNTNFGSKYGSSTSSVPVAASAAVVSVVPSSPKNEPKVNENASATMLYAQPTSYGYQLIDSEPKVVMKVYKTSNPANFMAKKGDIQGALVSKDNQWFFEYYQNDTLISEKIEVKF